VFVSRGVETYFICILGEAFMPASSDRWNAMREVLWIILLGAAAWLPIIAACYMLATT
jgi:hypothetical protein